MSEEENIDYPGIVDQLQRENEKLREELTGYKSGHFSDTLNDTIEGIVLIVQKSDPMKLYIWACIGFMLAISLARLIEVFR